MTIQAMLTQIDSESPEDELLLQIQSNFDWLLDCNASSRFCSCESDCGSCMVFMRKILSSVGWFLG